MWLRPVRYVRSKRPLAGWEPLLVYGGRPLPTTRTQTVLDVLDARGRFRSYPGALVGMKPPQFGVWLFALLGARPGDELVDLYPGSGAVSHAWHLHASRLPGTAARYASAA